MFKTLQALLVAYIDMAWLGFAAHVVEHLPENAFGDFMCEVIVAMSNENIRREWRA